MFGANRIMTFFKAFFCSIAGPTPLATSRILSTTVSEKRRPIIEWVITKFGVVLFQGHLPLISGIVAIALRLDAFARGNDWESWAYWSGARGFYSQVSTFTCRFGNKDGLLAGLLAAVLLSPFLLCKCPVSVFGE